VHERLTTLFAKRPGGFVSQMAPGPGSSGSIQDVRDLWDGVIGSTLA
jgi:hypothetical protein